MMSKWGADSLLVLHIVFLVVLGVLLLRVETAKRPETKEGSSSTQPSGIWQLLRSYPGYTWFLIAYTLLYMSSTLGTNFQIDVITSLGGDHTSLGYSEFLMAIAEVPVVFFYGKLKKRIGLNRVLFLIFLFGTAKVYCQSFAPNLPCFMLAQLWQMVSWGNVVHRRCGLCHAGGAYKGSGQGPGTVDRSRSGHRKFSCIVYKWYLIRSF